MKTKTRTLILALVPALFVFLKSATCYGGGITIITHGFSPTTTSNQAWINSFASSIVDRCAYPSSVTVYEINIVQREVTLGLFTNYIDSVSWLSGPTDIFLESLNGELIFKVNWSVCSSQVSGNQSVSSTVVAKMLVDYFINTRVSSHAWIEQPIHLVGHSRGASVCSEMARLFGSHGVWVEQQTTLDPHPVSLFGDAQTSVYENTLFADNYWENTWTWVYTPIPQYGPTYPAGESINGSRNLNLNSRFEADSLADGLWADHSRVVDWYYGTINLSDTALLSDSEHSIPRSEWYTSADNSGGNCGYTYSRIVGGTRPTDGLNWRFGGTTPGEPITRDTTIGSQWPNVFNLQISDERYTSQSVPEFQIGEILNLQFQYQSCDSQVYASLYLDTDQNPYNGNAVDILGSLIDCQATGGNSISTINARWDTGGQTNGCFYLYVRIEDGFGHVRYIYATKQIQFCATDNVLYVDATRPDDSGGGGDWTTAKRTIQAAINVAKDGDTILVKAGTYCEGSVLIADTRQTRVAITNKVTVKSINGPQCTAIVGGSGIRCVYIRDGATLDGFTLVNGQATRRAGNNTTADVSGGGAYCRGTIVNCIIKNNSAGAYWPELPVSVGQYTGGGGGVYLSGDSIARNCVIANNASQASGGGVRGGQILNCTIVDNSTLKYGAGVCQGDVSNSIIYYNSASDVYASSVTFSCSPNKSTDGNLMSEPDFVDYGAGDYRLKSSSPCINHGTNEMWHMQSQDLDGRARISGGVVDMGAYEYDSPPPCIVLFDPNGGSPCPSPIKGIYNRSYGALPEVARDGYVFLGWWIGTTGAGSRVDSSTIVTSTVSHTLYARWRERILYVDASRSDDSDDGGGWSTAKRTIQAAINVMLPGDCIIVTNGVYGAITTGDKEVSIRSVNGADVTIIDGGNTNRCATLGSSSGSTNTILTGFMLRNGYASQGGGSYGGTLKRCTYLENNATEGGGSYGGILSNCMLANNVAQSGGGSYGGFLNSCLLCSNVATNGGGSYVADLYGCTLSNNVAVTGGGSCGGFLNNCFLCSNEATNGGGSCGGDLYGCTISNNVAVTGGGSHRGVLSLCRLIGNSASSNGGAYYGGPSSDGILNNCTLKENKATGGGGGSYKGTLNRCVLSSNTAKMGGGSVDGTLNNCVLADNLAEFFGGGAYYGVLNNCTVTKNNADFSGGWHRCDARNCIVWDNLARYDDDNYQGGGSGNNCSDPRFVDTTKEDYRLRADSPYIDKGDNSLVQTTVDLAGLDRIMNGIVDAGAYEYFPNVIIVTLDPAGGMITPLKISVKYCSEYSSLLTPIRYGFVFKGWTTASTGGVEVTSSNLVTTICDHTLYAQWISTQPPLITMRTAACPPIDEGTSVSFSVIANDNTDPEVASRGMSNIIWYVDGIVKQVTKTGAPNGITSAFTLRTDASTVRSVANRIVHVKALAVDRIGGETEVIWTVQVNNLPVSQTITLPVFPVKVLGDPDFEVGAKASSDLPVVYTSSNESVAQVFEDRIRITGAGATVVTASQPGNFDFKPATPVKQTLTVKALLTAVTPNGGGTVSGTGLYVPGTKVALTAKPVAGNTFLRWEDGSQAAARSLTMPYSNTTVSAWFGLTTSVPKPTIADPDPQRAMVGVPFTLPISIISESLPTVTVTGLPSGLAYVPTSKSIAGVPTASVINKIVTVKAVNVNKVPGTNTFTITVDPLPVWAQGTFNGASGKDALGLGNASMGVTALGAATGKLTLRGSNFSFSAKSYSSREADGSFALVTTAKVGKVSLPLTLSVDVPEVTDTTGIVPPTLSKADGALTNGWMTLYRNVWKDAGMVTALTNNFAGYYTSALPGGAEYGSGYLTFTVDKAGGVKTAGKLADGTAVSLSGTLILDEAGRAWTVLYTAPVPYKGGGLFGLAEFFKGDAGSRVIVRLLDGEPLLWQNMSPQAVQTYGMGFNRELGIVGGWFDTVGNLYGYYSNRVISAGTETPAPVPEIGVGTNRYGSIWWDPDGIALSVVTNRLGVMTGLSAPGIGTPVKDGTSYDYENPTNAVGLTVALTRATGVFRGSFKAWFDYAATHTPKTVSYEGVLTPVREDTSDGVAGRGFFLWADKSQYLNPLNKPVPYSFSWSYDFKILLSEP